MARKRSEAPSASEVTKLFADVDETGHTNASTARKERHHRKKTGKALDIDPLADEDPSGSNVEKIIRKVATTFVVVVLVLVIVAQVSCGVIRRARTADLSNDVSVRTVTAALEGGVEWGNGFTQFPDDYTVDEADETTGRIEVTVIDTSSADALECLSGSQIQATALAINSLLNPNINTVVYHVSVHEDANGKFQKSAALGLIKPTGDIKSFVTFTWTKNLADTNNGFSWSCTISGIDSDLAAKIKSQISNSSTTIISTTTAATTSAATTDAATTAATASAQ
jgi:hypothetical protein